MKRLFVLLLAALLLCGCAAQSAPSSSEVIAPTPAAEPTPTIAPVPSPTLIVTATPSPTPTTIKASSDEEMAKIFDEKMKNVEGYTHCTIENDIFTVFFEKSDIILYILANYHKDATIKQNWDNTMEDYANFSVAAREAIKIGYKDMNTVVYLLSSEDSNVVFGQFADGKVLFNIVDTDISSMIGL